MTGAKNTAARQPLMTTPEAAAYLKFSEETLKDWRRDNTGPAYIKIHGAHVRYRVRDLDAWLDAQTVGAA